MKHQALTVFLRIDKRIKIKISHALQGTTPTLAAGAVAVIMLNLVQEFLDRSSVVTSSLVKLRHNSNTSTLEILLNLPGLLLCAHTAFQPLKGFECACLRSTYIHFTFAF